MQCFAHLSQQNASSWWLRNIVLSRADELTTVEVQRVPIPFLEQLTSMVEEMSFSEIVLFTKCNPALFVLLSWDRNAEWTLADLSESFNIIIKTLVPSLSFGKAPFTNVETCKTSFVPTILRWWMWDGSRMFFYYNLKISKTIWIHMCREKSMKHFYQMGLVSARSRGRILYVTSCWPHSGTFQ